MNCEEPAVPLAGGFLGRQRHVCAFFDTRDDGYRILLPFVKEGLERGEKAIQIVDPALRDDHLARLSDVGIDVEAAQAQGELEVLDWKDTYLRNGYFDRRAMSALVEDMLSRTRAEGFPRARIIGHMEWALHDGSDLPALVEYEARMNDVLPRYDDPVVCAYDRCAFAAGTAMDVFRAHPVVLLDGTLQQNPSFLPPSRLIPRLHTGILAVLRDRYLTALVAGARPEALEIAVEEALSEDVPVPSLYLEVIQAAQYEIGRLWQEKRLTVAQEHLATEISRSAIELLRPHLPAQQRNGKRAVVACVEGELHDLGARMVADFLEMAGFEVHYLGADVPSESLAQLVRERRPDLLAVSATERSRLAALCRTVAAVRAVPGDRIPIAAGGQVFLRKSRPGRRLGIDMHARDASGLIAVARRFFEQGSRRP